MKLEVAFFRDAFFNSIQFQRENFYSMLLNTLLITKLIGIYFSWLERNDGVIVFFNLSRYIRKDMLVEIGKGISPNFEQVLELLLAKGEYLAFAPDTEETRTMISLMSIKFPKLKVLLSFPQYTIFDVISWVNNHH